MTRKRQRFPSIPTVPFLQDASLRQFLDNVKTQLEFIQENPVVADGGSVNEEQLQQAVINAVSGITQGAPGSPGSPGSPGAPGQTFILDIIGGRTNIVYDVDGLNPIPTMTAFSAELYVDGILVTPTGYSWFIPNAASSLLSGTSTTETFTPTVAGTFAANKPDNTVSLTVSYAGKSISAREPITVTKLAKDGTDGADGDPGANGVNGVRTAILDVYQWALTEPTTFPSGDSTYTWATGQFTAPTLNGWSLTPSAPVHGHTLWIARRIYADNESTATTEITWNVTTASALSLAGEDGLPGDPGDPGDTGDPGANGTRTALLELYQWDYSAPVDFPVGDSTYTWATGEFTLPLTTNGWSLLPGVASPGQTLYACSVSYSDTLTSATSEVTWNTSTAYMIGAAGTDGTDGIDGANGKTALLFITGGKTNAVYDTSGLNPLPAPSAFSAELYVDGSLVAPDTFAWSVPASNTLMTGSGSDSTFTPGYATPYDVDKGDNRVLLTVTYDGLTVKAVQPVVMTRLFSTTEDTTPPQAISELSVFGGVLHNFLSWGALPAGVDHVQIWRNSEDDRSNAVVVGTTQNRVYKDFVPEGVASEYFYWIRGISRSGTEGDWNLVLINNEWVVSTQGTSATALGINSQQVDSIVAEKIFAVSLASITATLGDVSAGTLFSNDNRLQIDLNNKIITIGSDTADPVNNWNGGDYTRIQNGDITNYVWNGSVHVQAKALRTIETGIAANNEVVILGKYYATQPQIFITPRSLQVYSAANVGQDQTLNIEAKEITHINGAVTFRAVAELALSDNTKTVSINNTVSGSTNQTSATYVTDTNCVEISVDVNLSSYEGKENTGSSLVWWRRQVSLELQARLNGSGNAFVTIGTLANQDIGASTLNPPANEITRTVSGPTAAAGTWDYRVVATYSRVGTTFSTTGGGYEYTQNSTTKGSDGPVVEATKSSPTTKGASIGLSAPSSPGSGWSIYEVNYSVKYAWYTSANLIQNSLVESWVDDNAAFPFLHSTINSGSAGSSTLTNEATRSFTQGSFNGTQNVMYVGITNPNNGGTLTEARIKIKSNTSAVVKWRKATAFSTTPSNVLKTNSATYTLGAAVSLASGTLNYQAIL